MQLVVRPAAAEDLEGAFLWYERQRTGLGREFLAAAKVAFEKVLSNPEVIPSSIAAREECRFVGFLTAFTSASTLRPLS